MKTFPLPPMGTLPTHDQVVCPAVIVAIVLEELARLKAMEMLPTPKALLDAVQARADEYNLVAGVALAYLKGKVVNDER